MTLGQRLKILRINKVPKVTQEDVAKHIGTTRATYSNWEIDRALPDINSIVLLADYYNVSVDYLLDRKQPNKPEDTLNKRIAELPEDKRKMIETMLRVFETEREESATRDASNVSFFK